MPRSLVRRFMDRIRGLAGPGLGGIGSNGTGRDTVEGLGGVEIIRVAGGGPLRLTDRFSRERHLEKPAIVPVDLAREGGFADRPHVVE